MIASAHNSDQEILRQWNLTPNPSKSNLAKEICRLKHLGHELCEEWTYGTDTLPAMACVYRDVGLKRSAALRLCRHDSKKAFGPGNAFWSALGKPPIKIIVAGRETRLIDAALAAGVSPDALVSRMKKFGVESAILTDKWLRIPYPQGKAIEFLSRISLASLTGQLAAEAERKRWLELNPPKALKTKRYVRRQFERFLSSSRASSVLKVVSLPIPDFEKISLLAYYSTSLRTKKLTLQIYKGMKARCLNPSHQNYSTYGGRGVRICRRWLIGDGDLTGFQCFVTDMGSKQLGMELDRIDPDGWYEPANCRWVTRADNIRNTFSWKDVEDRIKAMSGELKVDDDSSCVPYDTSTKAALKARYAAVQRCTDPHHKNYDGYGGRGIRVCTRWLDGENGRTGKQCFLDDMLPKPVGYHLDRIDNDGDYEPANCRWVSHADNKRNSFRWQQVLQRMAAILDGMEQEMNRSRKRIAALSTDAQERV